ncbi:hypothetical protein EAF04_008964 [Stromatinia cepivora]|nr:hypothetical protein EAF04_008964 [Stromatinia cepivora]
MWWKDPEGMSHMSEENIEMAWKTAKMGHLKVGQSLKPVCSCSLKACVEQREEIGISSQEAIENFWGDLQTIIDDQILRPRNLPTLVDLIRYSNQRTIGCYFVVQFYCFSLVLGAILTLCTSAEQCNLNVTSM